MCTEPYQKSFSEAAWVTSRILREGLCAALGCIQGHNMLRNSHLLSPDSL